MKVTLAVALAVLTCNAAAFIHAPQQPAPPQMPQSGAAAAGEQQEGASSPVSKPCTESKDTCEVESSPQQPARPQDVKSQEPAHANPSPKTVVHRKKSRHHKSATKQVTAPDPKSPKKTVVRHGSTSDPAAVLTPGGTARADSTPQMTADLLSATDANLKEASSKPLTPNQEATVTQIKLFMEQANAAVKAGDLDRGHNLAIKAHLLSDDLVKH